MLTADLRCLLHDNTAVRRLVHRNVAFAALVVDQSVVRVEVNLLHIPLVVDDLLAHDDVTDVGALSRECALRLLLSHYWLWD